MIPIPVRVTLEVIDELDRLGIASLLVGSLASAAQGVPRSTIDSDLLVKLRPEHRQPLVAALEDRFYIADVAVREALERASMFNIVHFETAFKVDLYVLRDEPYHQTEFARGVRRQLLESEPRQVAMATPEDLVLSKLDWFRLGNQVSERQWKDVLGLLEVQAERLDWPYLERWAEHLKLGELLRRALREASWDSFQPD